MGKSDNLFAMKWVLPEHAKALSDYYAQQQLNTRPVIDQNSLAEMSQIISDSTRQDFAVSISWFNPEHGDLGHIHTAWGWVTSIDREKRRIKLVNDDDTWMVSFDQLIRVDPV